MTDTTNTPEQEMREIFASTISAISNMRDKVISTVVAHSQTERDLKELSQRFEELNRRMTSVVEEAQRVRQDLSLVIAERDKYKREAEDNLALAQGYEWERDEAKANNNKLREENDRVKMDLSDKERKINELNNTVASYANDTQYLKDDRNRWRERHDEALAGRTKAEAALKEAQAKLERLQAITRELFPVETKEDDKVIPKFLEPMQTPHPVQSVGEEPSQGVNERIDQSSEDQWWNKKTAL